MNAFRCFAVLGSASILLACSVNGAEPSGASTTALESGGDPAAPDAPAQAPFTLSIASPQNGAAATGTITVVGNGPGFLNVEAHSPTGELLARVIPDDAAGAFSMSIDTTKLPNGSDTLVIDAWDSPAGTEFTNHASTSLTVAVSNGNGNALSCVDGDGNGIRYFGAYTKNTQTNYDFDAWAGFHQDFLTSFINCDTWANAAASDWGFDIMQQQPPGENIQQIACLTTQEDPSLQHVASGMYDEQIRNIGRLFLKHNYPNAIVRVGHEFEGNWYPWGLWGGVNDGDVAGFIAAFRRASQLLKEISPTFTIVWNPGCSWLAQGADSEQAYPGDDVVDVIGVDCYDDNSGVDHLMNGAYGMNQWASFAKSHGKPIALPEWGLMTGGDNPQFIQAMFDFMSKNNTFLESFWDSDDGSTLSQITTGEAPSSGAKFLETFGNYARSCHP